MIDVTETQFLLVKKIHQTHDWTLIGSGANGIGILCLLALWCKELISFLNVRRLNPTSFMFFTGY